MKKSKNMNFRIVITGALTLPLALLFPSSSFASETGNPQTQENKPSIETAALQEVQAIKGSLPLISLSDSVIVVMAPSTASLSFERPSITSAPNPEIAKAKELQDAIVAAEKKKAEDEVKAKKKSEEEKAAAEKLFAAGDVSSIEVKGFMPKGTEKLTPIDDKLVSIAATGLGKPYVWGGTTPEGWDCSGYVQWVYAQAGIKIPRVNQWEAGKLTSNPVPGDIVVQNNNTHVGIYAGGGMMYSALNPSDGTRFHSVNIAPSYFIHIDRS